MLKVGIITGSTRPNRKSADVAKWVLKAARERSDAEYELVDIKDFELPLLDEPMPPSMGRYQQPHTKRWAAKIASLDAFVFVSPEYNHGIPAALKNAIDFLFADFETFTTFKPHLHHEKFLGTVLDQVVAWGGALKQLR